MKTLIKPKLWEILELFYNNHNKPLHLREISRRINLKEGPISRHLKYLIDNKILIFNEVANLKRFQIASRIIPEIYPLYDEDKFKQLPLLRRNAMIHYVNNLKKKPVFIILFGSTAKGHYRADSDIDVLEVFNEKTDTKDAIRYAEAQTSMQINAIQIPFNGFIEELKMKNEPVIQSAIETGYPIYNHKYYYEVLRDERN